jgi:hypothetical protein
MALAYHARIQREGKQQGEPLCEHPIQELVCLAHSNDGGLMGIYHCRKCGEAIIYVDKSSPFSKSSPGMYFF